MKIIHLIEGSMFQVVGTKRWKSLHTCQWLVLRYNLCLFLALTFLPFELCSSFTQAKAMKCLYVSMGACQKFSATVLYKLRAPQPEAWSGSITPPQSGSKAGWGGHHRHLQPPALRISLGKDQEHVRG